ncbi:unnamed protein product [Polarella glacialis]|uniref:Uncharacterized protein n=1 Tax=Polarella glacialis TaxID=89957 RepID=A0A813L9K0_POLGL|nr:unnamed protein product [Polarella glacialis]
MDPAPLNVASSAPPTTPSARFACSTGRFSSVVASGGGVGGGVHDATLGVVGGCLGTDAETLIFRVPENVDHSGKVTIVGCLPEEGPMGRLVERIPKYWKEAAEVEYQARDLTCHGEACDSKAHTVVVAESGKFTACGNPLAIGDHALHASWSDAINIEQGAPVVVGWRVHYPDTQHEDCQCGQPDCAQIHFRKGYYTREGGKGLGPEGTDLIEANGGPRFGLTTVRVAPTTGGCEWKVGEKVQGYFNQDSCWKDGVVTQVHIDSCDIEVHSPRHLASTELKVPMRRMRKDSELITNMSSSTPKNSLALQPLDKESLLHCRQTSIAVGSLVDFPGSERYDGEWDVGTVTMINGDQCDIKCRAWGNPPTSAMQTGVELARVKGLVKTLKCTSSSALGEGAIVDLPRTGKHVHASDLDATETPGQHPCGIYKTPGQHRSVDYDVLIVFDAARREVRACVGWGGAGARVDKVTVPAELWPSEELPLVPFVSFDTHDFGGYNSLLSGEVLPITFEALSRDQMDPGALEALFRC